MTCLDQTEIYTQDTPSTPINGCIYILGEHAKKLRDSFINKSHLKQSTLYILCSGGVTVIGLNSSLSFSYSLLFVR